MPVNDYISMIARNDILSAVVIMAASVIAARLMHFVLVKYVSRLTKATKTTLDDELLNAVKSPIYLAGIVVGAYFSLEQLTVLEKYAGTIDKAFVVIGIVIGAYTVSRILNTIINWHTTNLAAKTKTKVDEQFMPIIRRALSVFIYALGLVIVLDQLGIKVTALVASLGVASIAVALALQETLANFFSGLYIMADKPVRVGDFVQLENGDQGFIEEIGWRSTKVKLLANNIIILPNSKLAQSTIINYDLPQKEMSFVMNCGVAYGSDLEKVEKVTVRVARDVLKRTDGGVKDFEPFIRYGKFGDSNIEFSIILRVKQYVDKYLVAHEFIKGLMKEYAKEKIEVSWPVRKVYLSSGKSKD